MKKRLLISAGILAACLALVLGVLAMLPPHSGVTKANYDQVKKGMTLAEVENLFSKKGDRFDGYVGKPAFYWQNEDRSYALIFFDDDKKVVAPAQWGDSTETIGDKICRWLRWPWWK